MKTNLLVLGLFLFVAYTKAYSQKVMAVDMHDADCLHVIDGVISSPDDKVPGEQLAHYEQAANSNKLAELGFSNSPCVIVKSSVDLDIENYIYRQVHDQIQQIGTQYKIPIAVNGKLLPGYPARRSQLSKLQAAQIKQITFLNQAEAQAKYRSKVVFGLIEIKV